MHLYHQQDSVICLDFVASNQGQDGLDTEEVKLNHVYFEIRKRNYIQTILKKRGKPQKL